MTIAHANYSKPNYSKLQTRRDGGWGNDKLGTP